MGLARLVEHLELERPRVITVEELGSILQQLDIATSPSKAAFRLRARGWLLSTGVPGVYEFSPGERAGPISEGDVLMPLRAAAAGAPTLQMAAALGTALSLLNIADRGPDIPEVALPKGSRAPKVLSSTMRVVRFDWRLPAARVQGSPVHRAATVLVHLADRPSQVRSWGAMLELLPRIIIAAPIPDIEAELAWRPQATKIRLAYLTAGVFPGLADALKIHPASKVWFGPRGELKRHDAPWNVADTLLPMSPRDISAVEHPPA
jgi:hypothetical protein